MLSDFAHLGRRLAGGGLIWLLAAGTALAQNLEIIELRHRPADQVLPSLQAIVGDRGAATGTGFKLFVRADGQTLAQVRRMVAELDVAARRLLISVRQVDAGMSSQVRIQSGAQVSNRGASVVVAGSARSERSDSAVEQRIQTLDGARALIRVGEARLLPSVIVDGGSGNVGVVATPVETGTSVYVVPRLNGDQVLLDIEPQRSTFGPQGEIRQQSLTTQVSGRLGEWIDLGASDTQATGTGADLQARLHVQVKVELLP